MKKLKGIFIAVILSMASILMPFNVSAAVQSVIVPTFAGSTSEWSSHLSVTNFSDGTNNQASSTLSFTFDDDYYGYVYFDGYGPSNQHIANFATVFIAGGYGEYRYSYYQNGVINITSVTIQIVNVVKPDTTVDLTQIIQLLTAIETDTTAIDNVLDSTLIEIRSVLSQLIISNGYLETLTELRQYNFPIESFTFINKLSDNEIVDLFNDSYYQYPIFNVPTGYIIRSKWGDLTDTYEQIIIFGINRNIYNKSTLNQYFNITNGDILNVSEIYRNDYNGDIWSFVRIRFKVLDSSTSNYVRFNFLENVKFIPIWLEYSSNKRISTDFALRFSLSNNLLDNLNIIANGTSASNSASSDLNSESSQFSTDSQQLMNLEDSYNTQMNNNLTAIDTTTGLNGFGGYFMTSATWVRTQFDRLTASTPYGSMIVYGMTLGLALLLLGKVFL